MNQSELKANNAPSTERGKTCNLFTDERETKICNQRRVWQNMQLVWSAKNVPEKKTCYQRWASENCNRYKGNENMQSTSGAGKLSTDEKREKRKHKIGVKRGKRKPATCLKHGKRKHATGFLRGKRKPAIGLKRGKRKPAIGLKRGKRKPATGLKRGKRKPATGLQEQCQRFFVSLWKAKKHIWIDGIVKIMVQFC